MDEKGGPGRATRQSTQVDTRAGASRLTAFHGDANKLVGFKADGSIKMPGVEKARGSRRLGATMGAFTENACSRPEHGKLAVSNGAESVRVALAGQLALMGWLVEQVAAASETDTDPVRRKETRPLVRFGFRGKVAFCWQSGPRVKATVRGTVVLLDADNETLETIEVFAPAEVGEEVRQASKRAEEAQRRALAAFVSRFFTSDRLSDRLVKALRAKP